MVEGILGAGSISIGGIDIAVIVLYFVVIIGLGVWAGLQRRGATESAGYFLAGGTLTWPLIGMALFSTNISTIHLVSQAQEGYVNGLAYGNFEWMAPFLLITLSLFFAPFYFRSKVATLPDFLEQRYSRGCRDWLAAMSIISAIVIHIGFTLYTGRGRAGRDVRHRQDDEHHRDFRRYGHLYHHRRPAGGRADGVASDGHPAGRRDPDYLDRIHSGRRLAGRHRPRRAGQADDPALGERPGESAVVLGLPGLSRDRTVVLVRRSDDRAAGAGGQGREPRPRRPAVCRVHQDPAGPHLRLSGDDLPGVAPAGQNDGPAGACGSRVAATLPQMSDVEQRIYQAVRDYNGQDGRVRVDYIVSTDRPGQAASRPGHDGPGQQRGCSSPSPTPCTPT